MNIPFLDTYCRQKRVLQPLDGNRQRLRRQDPSEKIGQSKALDDHFDLPRRPPKTRREFDIFDDNQIKAAEFLVKKELFAGNNIKLCVGVDDSVTQSLRASREDIDRNRPLLQRRIEYGLRHADEERTARNVYEIVRDAALTLLRGAPYQVLWPFVMVYSCYEFTSIRRDFQHGHCLYLMVTIACWDDFAVMRVLQEKLQQLVDDRGGKDLLDVIIQQISSYSALSENENQNEDALRLLDTPGDRKLPRNIDYHPRPSLGCSIGPAANGMTGTIGGYVASESGSVFAMTASHVVGAKDEAVVSPSTTDLSNCFRYARGREEISLQSLDYDIRSVGPRSKQTYDSRRRWEVAQEELLMFADVNNAPGTSSRFGSVFGKLSSSFDNEHGGLKSQSWVDLAIIECDRDRVGFNTVPVIEKDGRTTLVEVLGARSPITGESVIKNGRSSGLTSGSVLSTLASVGWYDKKETWTVNGLRVDLTPHILLNWCITSNYGQGETGIFAEPGDSGAWVLARPYMPPIENPETIVSTRNAPVVGSIMHGFISADGIDLVMFQPWEHIAHGFQVLTGERCVPLHPLSCDLAGLRQQQGFTPGCGVCLCVGVNHFVEDCPERHTLRTQRKRQSLHRLNEIEIYEPPLSTPEPMDIQQRSPSSSPKARRSIGPSSEDERSAIV